MFVDTNTDGIVKTNSEIKLISSWRVICHMSLSMKCSNQTKPYSRNSYNFPPRLDTSGPCFILLNYRPVYWLRQTLPTVLRSDLAMIMRALNHFRIDAPVDCLKRTLLSKDAQWRRQDRSSLSLTFCHVSNVWLCTDIPTPPSTHMCTAVLESNQSHPPFSHTHIVLPSSSFPPNLIVGTLADIMITNGFYCATIFYRNHYYSELRASRWSFITRIRHLPAYSLTVIRKIIFYSK